MAQNPGQVPAPNIRLIRIPPSDASERGVANQPLLYRSHIIRNNNAINATVEDARVRNLLAQADKHAAEAEVARERGRDEVANAPLVRDLLRTVREMQAARDAREVEVDELEYLRALKINPGTQNLGHLVGAVAAFAAEDPHDLLSTQAKDDMRDAAGQIVQGQDWTYYVSDKFNAHATEACGLIRARFNHVRGMNVGDMVQVGDHEVRVRVARLVASLWRQSAVVSAKRYSTTKAIDTLQRNIDMHLRSFQNVVFSNNMLLVQHGDFRRPLPRDIFL